MANYSLTTKAFKLEGVPEMKKTLLAMQKSMTQEADEKYREQVKDVMMIPAKMIRDEAKDLVPVVTGRLQAAIFAAPFIKGGGALAGVHVKDAYYAPFVEYGTSRTHPHPYFRPAILATRPIAATVIAEGLRKVIDSVASDNAHHGSSG